MISRVADYAATARLLVDDYLGEGVIAFPELVESLNGRDLELPADAAASIAKLVLSEYFSSGRLRIHYGPIGAEREVAQEKARTLIEDPRCYRYAGDGIEARAWFSLD
jgi:hypothetical protein